MSDNIDYDELDKAVNEAIKSRAAAKPAAKPTSKKATAPKVNVVKNTTIKPVVRSHGQYMDFVAKRPLSTATPVAQPVRPVAQQPIVKRVLQPQPARPSTARPAVARPVTKPVITKPVARVQRPIATKAHATQPVNHSVAQEMQHKQQIAQTKATPAPKPAVKTTTEEDSKAPNANNYSLGGRSPFMINTKVDKRPLGTNIPESSAHTVRSTNNTYSQKDPSINKKHKANKHIVTESPKKHSGWIWTLIVLLVIAAGAGLGYLAYLLVFAN